MFHKLGQILSLAKGRDKVFKFLCYFCRFLAGFHLVPPELCGPLNLFARQLSAWRLTHRLADGFLQVRSISKSGWTGGEEDWLSALLLILTNLADLFYYPADNIAWAGQHKILPISSETWFHYSNYFWAISLYLNMATALRKLYISRRKLAEDENSEESVRKFKTMQKEQYPNLIQAGCDLMNAIHWLPAGYLWAGQLSQGRVGLNGAISAAISLYKLQRTIT